MERLQDVGQGTDPAKEGPTPTAGGFVGEVEVEGGSKLYNWLDVGVSDG